MVFFTCNVCGEALKKNQVEKHCMTKCRGCEMVSCIDCGKDFWGNDYEQHTKCISEEQKYSGKGYVPKVNKGEAKQDRWIEQVQIAIDKNMNNPRLRGTLESIKNYPNIPRKKNKFENFLMNSMRLRDRNFIAQLWDVLMEEASKNMSQSADITKPDSKPADGTAAQQNLNGVAEMNSADSEEKKLSKRERKEERRKKTNKKEKKDKNESELTETVDNGESKPAKKKKKKRKHEEDEEEEEEEEVETKGKKRKREEKEELPEEGDGEDEEEEDEPGKKKTKFNWECVIKEVLTTKGEISLKKLRKKVLSEYMSQMGEIRDREEKLWAKFDKKVSKNPNFKVFKERVKLIEQT